MTDFCDQGSAQEQLDRDAALAAVQARLAGPSLTHCIDCEEPIDPARQQAAPGCRRCLDCQQDAELRELERRHREGR
ncbi:TraR/DksA C4-type zinc finger protein [Laribacter hongkongensis]|uniref:TraR/DksA C4-type zinc finger protein n=1 Tax=Laribacter hongkongensis TaxID=168471 RepID=UPI001EFE9A4C|nr:TraR/DksA C4-type zinc finger protein [Laribacter hongkongensis]MCG9081589.1 TraR/DksA C4-type zinc finger protein [Laribacter hongkongensis]MCG9081591.1 TraR/DksA C4-type zinc finger protein [Laribacter hongkongensis]